MTMAIAGAHDSAHDDMPDDQGAGHAKTESPPADGPIEAAIAQILAAVGEDPARPGLRRTPERVARMYGELMSGYGTDPVALINNAIFTVEYDDMVIVGDIEFFSMCEHHMLPFLGKAFVAYLPQGKVLGLSKIPRIVDMFARRLQIQERMTRQIATFIEETLEPAGVAVVLEGMHMCAAMRGVKKSETRMVTSAMLGRFKTERELRDEFLTHLGRGSSKSI